MQRYWFFNIEYEHQYSFTTTHLYRVIIAPPSYGTVHQRDLECRRKAEEADDALPSILIPDWAEANESSPTSWLIRMTDSR